MSLAILKLLNKSGLVSSLLLFRKFMYWPTKATHRDISPIECCITGNFCVRSPSMAVFNALLILKNRYPNSCGSCEVRICRMVCKRAVAMATTSGFG